MSTGFIFRFEGDKLLQPFLIPQSLFTPKLQGNPTARELRRQQELEANHMLLENIEKEMKEAARVLDFERAAQLRDILIELRNS